METISMLQTPQEYASVLIPKPCPYPLVRIGGTGDGAYLVPDDLEGIKVCFSPGVNNIKYFEDELTMKYGMICHMCDYSCSLDSLATPLIDGKQTFQKKWLDVRGRANSISLDDWVKDLSPNGDDDLLLQMDIEGAEWRNLNATSDETLSRFRIIVIELHGILDSLSDYSPDSLDAQTLERLDRNFVCVYAHPNNCCGDGFVEGLDINVPQLLEVTLLRRDRFSAPHAGSLRQSIFPHPLDIGRNVHDKPPLFLNAAWTGGLIDDGARVRMLEDELDYHKMRYSTLVHAKADMDEIFETWKNSYIASLNRAPLKEDSELFDVALNKPYKLSTAYSGTPDQGLIKQQEPFLFHTGFGAHQFILVDLLEQYRLESIAVQNRSDGAFERARFLFASTSETGEEGSWYTFPLNITAEFVEKSGGNCTTPTPDSIARYVKIFSPPHSFLHLSGINVYGTPAPRSHPTLS